jgi:hypothetical protein
MRNSDRTISNPKFVRKKTKSKDIDSFINIRDLSGSPRITTRKSGSINLTSGDVFKSTQNLLDLNSPNKPSLLQIFNIKKPSNLVENQKIAPAPFFEPKLVGFNFHKLTNSARKVKKSKLSARKKKDKLRDERFLHFGTEKNEPYFATQIHTGKKASTKKKLINREALALYGSQSRLSLNETETKVGKGIHQSGMMHIKSLLLKEKNRLDNKKKSGGSQIWKLETAGTGKNHELLERLKNEIRKNKSQSIYKSFDDMDILASNKDLMKSKVNLKPRITITRNETSPAARSRRDDEIKIQTCMMIPNSQKNLKYIQFDQTPTKKIGPSRFKTKLAQIVKCFPQFLQCVHAKFPPINFVQSWDLFPERKFVPAVLKPFVKSGVKIKERGCLRCQPDYEDDKQNQLMTGGVDSRPKELRLRWQRSANSNLYKQSTFVKQNMLPSIDEPVAGGCKWNSRVIQRLNITHFSKSTKAQPKLGQHLQSPDTVCLPDSRPKGISTQQTVFEKLTNGFLKENRNRKCSEEEISSTRTPSHLSQTVFGNSTLKGGFKTLEEQMTNYNLQFQNGIKSIFEKKQAKIPTVDKTDITLSFAKYKVENELSKKIHPFDRDSEETPKGSSGKMTLRLKKIGKNDQTSHVSENLSQNEVRSSRSKVEGIKDLHLPNRKIIKTNDIGKDLSSEIGQKEKGTSFEGLEKRGGVQMEALTVAKECERPHDKNHVFDAKE